MRWGEGSKGVRGSDSDCVVPANPCPVCVAVPSAPPRKVEVESVNSTAIRVSWKLPISNKQHGQIRGYQVTYVKLENNEPRGQPVIKDVMLSEAQVQCGDHQMVGMAPSLSAEGRLAGSKYFMASSCSSRAWDLACLSKANSLSLNCGLDMGKKFNQERITVEKMMYWMMFLSYPFSDAYLSACHILCRLQLEQTALSQSIYKWSESFKEALTLFLL